MASPSSVIEVKKLFDRTENGLCFRGSFVNYSIDLRSSISQGQITSAPANQIAQALGHITFDLWNLGSLIARLEWIDALATKGDLNREQWRSFCSLDIEHFHIELRSILDYAAKCITAAAEKPEEVPKKSMNDLLKWVPKPGNRTRLGKNLSTLVENVPSFPDIKEIRDETIHRGGLTLVFGEPGTGILFQVHSGFFRRMVKPLVPTATENVVNSIVTVHCCSPIFLCSLNVLRIHFKAG